MLLENVHTVTLSRRHSGAVGFVRIAVDSSEHRPSDVTHLNALLGNVNHQEQQLYALTVDAAYTVNEDGHVMKMHAGQFIDLGEGTISVHARVNDMLRVVFDIDVQTANPTLSV